MIKRYLRAQIPLFSDQAALYCFFLFLIWDRGGHFGSNLPLLYLLAGSASALANTLGSGKVRTVGWVVSLNAATVLFCCTLVFLGGKVRGGIPLLFITALICIYPSCRSLYLMYNPVTTRTMLSYCELSILGTSFFLVIQIGDFAPGNAANLLCITAFILNICMLSLLRMEEKILPRGGTVQAGNFQRNLIMFLVFTLLLLMTSGLSLLFFPQIRGGIMQAASSVKNGVLAALKQVGQWISYLLSLLPGAESGMILPEPQQQGAFDEYNEELDLIPAEWLHLIGAVALLAVLSLLLILYLRWRKSKIRSARTDAGMLVERSKTPSLRQIFLEKWRKIIAALRDQLRFLRCYNSCTGVFLRLEQAAKRKGYPRRKEQTPREFLVMLAEKTAAGEQRDGRYQKKKPDDSSGREISSLFSDLADEIDEFCFGKPAQAGSLKTRQARMDQERILLMLRAVKALRQEGKATAKRERNSQKTDNSLNLLKM